MRKPPDKEAARAEEAEFDSVVKASEQCGEEIGGCDSCNLLAFCNTVWDKNVNSVGSLGRFVDFIKDLRRKT